MRRSARRDNDEYLDEQEQRDLISSLIDKDQKDNVFYIKIMSFIGFFCGFIKFLCAVLPFNVVPFENAAHTVLVQSNVPGLLITWFEWMSAAAYIAGGVSMYPNIIKGFFKKWVMLVSCIFTFFGTFVMILITGSLFTALWVFGVNCAFLVGCIYVTKLTSNTQSEIISLESFTYPHKKA
ncbi:hypothetical protein CYY_001946 [Polysphondylium violaceum]|uniref:Transmembrane protein n=1 Tax=Polysphondylium violaceum TaxID=133409 RepID=A0A8J4V7E3_9MYCE|nr:hypothetical protein CYY_001946 [Polysphondylium violaceum]